MAPDGIAAKLGEVLPAVFAHAMMTNAGVCGQPFSRYHEMLEGMFKIEAGCPVTDQVEGTDGIQFSALPGGRAITLEHWGPYETLGCATTNCTLGPRRTS